ncbi:MAG: cell wall hydrolase [Oscillospiraceae bacterium]|nr:cell wall hydrolase [Oscillospiraceae bacterium]
MKARLLCSALLSLALSALPAGAEFLPEVDYAECMAVAAERGDLEAGRRAARERDEKIAAMGREECSIDFDELLLLSRLIFAEAGSCWLDMDWKMAVGEVALNRVASPEFPGTLREVVAQPGQYYYDAERYLEGLSPDRPSIDAALRLLGGERVINNPAVLFQANTVLGGGVALELRDERLGSTYLCYSSHMELYPPADSAESGV